MLHFPVIRWPTYDRIFAREMAERDPHAMMRKVIRDIQALKRNLEDDLKEFSNARHAMEDDEHVSDSDGNPSNRDVQEVTGVQEDELSDGKVIEITDGEVSSATHERVNNEERIENIGFKHGENPMDAWKQNNAGVEPHPTETGFLQMVVDACERDVQIYDLRSLPAPQSVIDKQGNFKYPNDECMQKKNEYVSADIINIVIFLLTMSCGERNKEICIPCSEFFDKKNVENRMQNREKWRQMKNDRANNVLFTEYCIMREETQQVFAPVYEPNHWSFFVADRRNKKIHLVNSMGSTYPTTVNMIKDQFRILNWGEMTHEVVKVERQLDGYSCGLRVLSWILFLVRNPDKTVHDLTNLKFNYDHAFQLNQAISHRFFQALYVAEVARRQKKEQPMNVDVD